MIAVLTPDDLTRRTLRAIIAGNLSTDDDYIKIAGEDWHIKPMEGDYDENFQIKAKEGDIIVFNMFTYGYGDFATWKSVSAMHDSLVDWCEECKGTYNFSYEIRMSANYW